MEGFQHEGAKGKAEQKKAQGQGGEKGEGAPFQAAPTEPGTKDPFVWAEPWSQTEQIREEISKSLPPERLSVS